MDKKKKKPTTTIITKFNSPITLILHLILALQFPLTLAAVVSDRITSTTPLSGDQTILSSDGTFRLGFYQPVANANRFYIATWYNKISKQTPVWVANRDSPVPDKHSFSFKISSHGHLILTNSSSTTATPVWSTNSTTPFWPTDSVPSTPATPESVEAVLLKNGNLVLRLKTNDTTSTKTTSSSSSYYWQSFDHPAHTWLPGSKFGLNKLTGQTQLLTSWKDSIDPSTGLYSLTLDPNGTSQYLILWNRTRQYWTSGVWDDNHHIFTLVPEMRLNYIYNFSYVDTVNESYFVYSVYDPTYVSRFVIDVSGQIKQFTWLQPSQQWNLFWSQPRQQCEVYAFCGGNGLCDENGLPFCRCVQGFRPADGVGWGLRDYSGGCVRNTPLLNGNNNTGGCRRGGGGNTTTGNNNTDTDNNKDEDRFWPYENVDLPDNPVTVTAGKTADECQSICLRNCSCTAYSYGGGGNGCSIWTGDLLDLKQQSDDSTGGGKTLYLRLAASEFPTTRSHKKTAVVVVVAASVGGAVLAAAVVVTVLLCCRRKARRSSGGGGGAAGGGEGTLVAFSYKELQTATKNFSEKLGGGGFGSVFKGTLRAGGEELLAVAVKKLESISQGEKQFRTEVSTIGTIQHVNLVRLRGFCSEGGDKKLLVYDYMPNGSLDAHLFTTTAATTTAAAAANSVSTTTATMKRPVLDWKTRYQIALGTARGLTYLHEKCRDCIIHCDIKPENILLDKDYCPKVADFGLAKLVGRDFSRVLTTMRGTRGYLAPEWISGVAITAKADVYSYGMMLFELVSGRRNTDQSEDGKVVFFPTWAAAKVVAADAAAAAEESGGGAGDILSIVDPRLEGVADGEEVMRMCKLGCWCIQDDENRRPSMGQVVQILEGVVDVNTPPMPRSLQVFADNILHEHNNIVFFTESSESSTSSSAVSKAKTATSTSTASNSAVSETRRSGVQSGVSNGSVVGPE